MITATHFWLDGDDLKITSISEIAHSAKYLYMSWTGRIIPHILVGIFMTTSTILFKVINTILFVILLIYISKFIRRKTAYLPLVVAFGFLVYGKMFGEKFAWISRKFKLFVDKRGFNSVFIQYIWIFCGRA